MYKTKEPFTERFDGNKRYNAGDAYPREGFTPPEGRAEALASGDKGPMNRTGNVYLKPVSTPKAKKTAED